ncbi:MAG: hypothetical protein U9N82_05725 [Thermodesulfobacteriota bacterium]|nr:hypothetical protein [Thermodesulfobacteriota bacterium]
MLYTLTGVGTKDCYPTLKSFLYGVNWELRQGGIVVPMTRCSSTGCNLIEDSNLNRTSTTRQPLQDCL